MDVPRKGKVGVQGGLSVSRYRARELRLLSVCVILLLRVCEPSDVGSRSSERNNATPDLSTQVAVNDQFRCGGAGAKKDDCRLNWPLLTTEIAASTTSMQGIRYCTLGICNEVLRLAS